mmetsp:Transcript_107591/g.309670  ORF Transcript_107591/g.309670 Transcript_107591/m.309670 type:complete len:260 (+) Transcript_107591:218-997(+)
MYSVVTCAFASENFGCLLALGYNTSTGLSPVVYPAYKLAASCGGKRKNTLLPSTWLSHKCAPCRSKCKRSIVPVARSETRYNCAMATETCVSRPKARVKTLSHRRLWSFKPGGPSRANICRSACCSSPRANGAQPSSATRGNAKLFSSEHLRSKRCTSSAYSTYSSTVACTEKAPIPPSASSSALCGDLARQVHSSQPHSLRQCCMFQARAAQSRCFSTTIACLSSAGGCCTFGTSRHSATAGPFPRSFFSARYRHKDR